MKEKIKAMRVIKDYFYSKKNNISLLEHYMLVTLYDHFEAHGGTFDEDGNASTGMGYEQLYNCTNDKIGSMTYFARVLYNKLNVKRT